MKKIFLLLFSTVLYLNAAAQCASTLTSVSGTPGTYCSGDPFVINLVGDVAGAGENFIVSFITTVNTAPISAYTTLAGAGFTSFDSAWTAIAVPWADNALYTYNAVAHTLTGTLPVNTTGAPITITYYVGAQNSPIDFTVASTCAMQTLTVTVGAEGVGVCAIPCSAINGGIPTSISNATGGTYNCGDAVLFGDSLAVVPNVTASGNIAGINYLVSSAPITSLTALSSALAGAEDVPANATIQLVNDGSFITTSGVYYITAVVSGNYTPSTTIPGTGVYDPACSIIGPSISFTFNVVAPTNDICTGATPLTFGASISTDNYCGNVTGASDTIGVGTCALAGQPSSASVWFSFVAPGPGQCSISVTNAQDIILGVFSGSCGSLTNIYCQDSLGVGGESELLNIAAAGTYYVVVQSWGSGNIGAFDILATNISMATSIEEASNNSNFSVSPNPANDVVSISLKGTTTSPIILELLDVTGKIILSENATTNQTKTISVADLADGVYFLRAVQNGYLVATRRIAVN